MPYAKKFDELSRMSREDLVDYYDATTPSVVVGLDFIRQEIARRDAQAANEAMMAMTRQMRNMTGAITLLTIVNVILVAIALFLQ